MLGKNEENKSTLSAPISINNSDNMYQSYDAVSEKEEKEKKGEKKEKEKENDRIIKL